jgi:predicted DNA-binding ribbon-helix-helix protein
LCAQDYYRWLEQIVLSLRQQKFYRLDLENLIEEIEDIRRSENRSLESNLRLFCGIYSSGSISLSSLLEVGEAQSRSSVSESAKHFKIAQA